MWRYGSLKAQSEAYQAAKQAWYAHLEATLRNVFIYKEGIYVHMVWNIFSIFLKGNIKKNVYFDRDNIRSHGMKNSETLRNMYGCDLTENGDFEYGTCVHMVAKNE